MSRAVPAAWPVLGHLPAFRASSARFLLSLAREQGDVAWFRLGQRPAVLLSHPDHVRQVLVDHAAQFAKGRLMQRARRLLGDGLLTSEGEKHRAQRRRIQPVFRQECLREYADLVPELAAQASGCWRDGVPLRVDTAMDALMMRIVARALLGVDIVDQLPELGRALRRIARWAPLLAAPGGRLLERTRLPILGRLRTAIETVELVIDRQIDHGGAGAPLLGALLGGAPGAPPMPPQQVRDEVMTIFLAGFDTTAAALTWAWLLLGAHADAEARLHCELDGVLGARDPRVEDLPRLPYASALVREVLRLYPPIARIGRRPLCDVELGDVTLPRDSVAFLSPYVTQRDPRWFDDPDAFRPERWGAPDPGRPRFAWFPFGAGPRSCVGEHLATTVLVLALATVAGRWRLLPARPGLPPARSLLTLKPRGAVWMTAAAR